jgi:hypothetical protein
LLRTTTKETPCIDFKTWEKKRDENLNVF